jgi:protein-S-isoprenylcysteine O-methyltransferase Ste14
MQKLVTPILMWAIVVGGVAVSLAFIARAEIIKPGIFTWVIVPVGIFWLCIVFKGIRLHRQAPLSAAGIDHLVTEGIFARVRHPLYSVHILLAWSAFLMAPQLRVLISVIWFSIVLVVWMKLEEWALIQKFGDEYRNYKRQVPMMIPKLSPPPNLPPPQ